MQKEEVVKAVEAFGNHLKEKLGDSMVASLIYGSLIKGDYDTESSDHNIALILKDDQATTLRAVAGAMRAKRPSRKTGLLLLTTDEIARARDVFPQDPGHRPPPPGRRRRGRGGQGAGFQEGRPGPRLRAAAPEPDDPAPPAVHPRREQP